MSRDQKESEVELGALLDDAKSILPEAITLRRRLHEHPELGLDLPRTRAAVLEALQDLPYEITTSARSSGVVATLRGARPGPTILLRADMDALPMPEDTDLPFKSKTPGAMHACGHDSHVAMLAGAARLLARYQPELAGNVKLMFQPGEEGHHGARVMIEEGLLEQPTVDAAFAIHIFPILPTGVVATRPGPLLAAADEFTIEVVGRGGHASMPHDAHDPIPVACEIVQAVQTFVTRRINAFDPAIITVGRIASGTTHNVIPESAVLEGTIRAVSPTARKLAHEGIERVAKGIAAAHGLEARVALEYGYPVTINHADFARFSMEVAGELLGRERVVEQPAPAMGAEDFSYVLERVPGAMVILGVRPEGVEKPAPCHSNRMLMDERGMAVGMALHAAMALRYLDGTTREFAPPRP
jgi:hippurate hydrolase